MEFTRVEIDHLITLMDTNEREGWYFAPRKQYWKRHERIKEKLNLSRREVCNTRKTSSKEKCSRETIAKIVLDTNPISD